MRIKLFTRDGGFVHEAQLPDFNPGPGIVLWGERVFTRDVTSLIESDGSRTVRYTEGFLYVLPEGATS